MQALERAVRLDAVADPREGAGLDQHHLGEILAARAGAQLGIDMGRADRRRRSGDRHLDLLGLVDQRAGATMVMGLSLAAPGLRRGGGKLGDAPLDRVADLGRVGARRAAEHQLGRDHVRGLGRAGMDIADADHRRVERRHVAADDALQAEHELRLRIGDVGREMRLRAAMAADAAEGDLPAVGRGQERPDRGAEMRGRQPRRVVQTVDGVAGKAFEQPIGQHGVGAAAPLLRRLEDHDRGAGEIRVLGEVARRTQQHRGVAVMAAGMHLAGIGRGMRHAGQLLQRQAVHVGAQADGALARPLAADHPADAGSADALGHFDAPLPHVLRHERRGAMLFQPEFRMGVDVAANRRERRMVPIQPGVELRRRHHLSPSRLQAHPSNSRGRPCPEGGLEARRLGPSTATGALSTRSPAPLPCAPNLTSARAWLMRACKNLPRNPGLAPGFCVCAGTLALTRRTSRNS